MAPLTRSQTKAVLPVFGLFKRRRQPKADALRNARAPSTTQPPPTPPDAAAEREQAQRNWYTSSRDLHDGLVVSEESDETLPAPLDNHEPPERH